MLSEHEERLGQASRIPVRPAAFLWADELGALLAYNLEFPQSPRGFP